jgi:hypothetical protein
MNQYLNDFSSQLKDLKVLAISPDTLMFRFAIKKNRIIKVIPAFEYEPGSSMVPDSLVSIDPQSIEAEGPDLFVDTIRFIRTLPVKITQHGALFSRSLGLQEVHKLVKFKPDKVNLSIGKKP